MNATSRAKRFLVSLPSADMADVVDALTTSRGHARELYAGLWRTTVTTSSGARYHVTFDTNGGRRIVLSVRPAKPADEVQRSRDGP